MTIISCVLTLVLQCGQGHICVQAAKSMWSHMTKNTSECGLSGWISNVFWGCSHLYLKVVMGEAEKAENLKTEILSY